MAYLPINRKLFDHFLWDERRVFSRFEAWLDLIQLVSYTADNTKIINGVVVEWGRGQYPISRSFLSDRWCWGPQKIRGFLALLKLKGQITLKSTSVCTIITLCNYEYYNGEQPTEDNSDNQRTTSGQPEINKVNKINNNNIYKGGKKEKAETDFSEEVKELYNSVVILFEEKTRPQTPAQIRDWHDTLDKCIRIDGYTADQIREIVKRMRMDDFWRSNFMSIMKLRQTNKEKVKYIHVFAERMNSRPKRSFGIPEKQRDYITPQETF